ncbi:MAG: hypothetical protein ACPIG6_09870 [Akkermansiaceae bacterium]
MNELNTNTMIDRKQLAARWKISIPTLKRMEARGELQPVAISERIIRYNLAAIERIEGAVVAGKESV